MSEILKHFIRKFCKTYEENQQPVEVHIKNLTALLDDPNFTVETDESKLALKNCLVPFVIEAEENPKFAQTEAVRDVLLLCLQKLLPLPRFGCIEAIVLILLTIDHSASSQEQNLAAGALLWLAHEKAVETLSAVLEQLFVQKTQADTKKTVWFDAISLLGNRLDVLVDHSLHVEKKQTRLSEKHLQIIWQSARIALRRTAATDIDDSHRSRIVNMISNISGDSDKNRDAFITADLVEDLTTLIPFCKPRRNICEVDERETSYFRLVLVITNALLSDVKLRTDTIRSRQALLSRSDIRDFVIEIMMTTPRTTLMHLCITFVHRVLVENRVAVNCFAVSPFMDASARCMPLLINEVKATPSDAAKKKNLWRLLSLLPLFVETTRGKMVLGRNQKLYSVLNSVNTAQNNRLLSDWFQNRDGAITALLGLCAICEFEHQATAGIFQRSVLQLKVPSFYDNERLRKHLSVCEEGENEDGENIMSFKEDYMDELVRKADDSLYTLLGLTEIDEMLAKERAGIKDAFSEDDLRTLLFLLLEDEETGFCCYEWIAGWCETFDQLGKSAEQTPHFFEFVEKAKTALTRFPVRVTNVTVAATICPTNKMLRRFNNPARTNAARSFPLEIVPLTPIEDLSSPSAKAEFFKPPFAHTRKMFGIVCDNFEAADLGYLKRLLEKNTTNQNSSSTSSSIDTKRKRSLLFPCHFGIPIQVQGWRKINEYSVMILAHWNKNVVAVPKKKKKKVMS